MTQTLLQQIAQGQPTAFDDFLRKHTNSVWGLARRYCRSAEDAEDATQEIFVEVWKNAERYDPDIGSELTFLMTIARRRLIDRARRLGRRPTMDSIPEAEQLADRETKSQVEQAEQNDEVDRAQQALKQLRPEQQLVLEMSLGEGRTHQEIADEAGIPLGTVKSHARRGLIRLRKLLDAEPPANAKDAYRGNPEGSR
jgi:RNA polymerase sigma factor (sigma-70 family)